jgi:ABC-type polysaccharide/polyol phosphate transport system ATPase subunit
MAMPAISVENLSKRYLVGHRDRRVGHYGYIALRDVIGRELHNFARKALDVARGRPVVQGDSIEEYWALKDVTFEVREGEVLGIIGHNGAGKSTLLKILSRITEPTSGRVVLRGRLASLLEVGTGFHPELSGRENIYLNGAILGMSRAEIRNKFDEIVTFAQVERFLDTPVKRYSSGMYVRLAFAVAAHLEPEILVVDEVLAVGDADFQKKCLGKMDDISRREGRTVIFVSHNMAAITELASRAVVLENGSVVIDDVASQAVSTYLSKGAQKAFYVSPHDDTYDDPHVARIEISTSQPNAVHHFGEEFQVKFWIRHNRPLARGCFSFHIINQFQTPVIHAWALYPTVIFGLSPGESVLICRFPSLRLNVGNYHLRTHLSEPRGGPYYETIDNICDFQVIRLDPGLPFWGFQPEFCVYHERHSWETVESELSMLAKS